MKILSTIALITLSMICFSQNVEFTKTNFPEQKKAFRFAKKCIKKGDAYFYGAERGYNEALLFYLDANEVNPNNALLNYKIAVCYLNTLEKYKAYPYARKAGDLNASIARDYYYVLGMAAQQKLKFDEAILAYDQFEAIISHPDTLKMVAKRIEECNNGKQFVLKVEYEVENVGDVINTTYAEYVPLIRADETILIYTSRRPADETKKRTKRQISNFDYDYYENIYKSNRIETNKWGTPSRIPAPINKPKKHSASVSLSLDGSILYLYHSINKGDIYFSKKEGESWSEPKELPGKVNTKKYTESHITVSFDGKTAYLVSDRPGGLGGKDIWRSELQSDQTWSEPVNLGPTINTPYDEDGPFLHPDGKTLYFSSKGHNTMGGYDIFETEFKDGQWTTPINMGYPINSPDDDVYFVLTADGKNAYLSSVKENGYGRQDIYCIRPFEKKVFKDFQMVLFKGILKDKETDALVKGIVNITDNSSGQEMFESEVQPTEEGFLVSLPSGKNYGIAVESEGYLFYSENFDLKLPEGFKLVEKVIYLEKVKAGVKLTLNNVFFDFDKHHLKSESESELNRAIELLNKYPGIKIEIAGHTDNIGEDAYNQKLSERRANSVKEYLIKAGFPESRIIRVVGYGESKPIDPSDSKEARAKNRRVEFILAE
ncbi:MAG: OmpA family protein [Candidatus Competibacteraceae bacterium]|nr:OmpA family protein [Candidatus Competibacteraceae bacterium]